MLNIVLYQPEIPPNTGNIIRLCANTGYKLHLIEPLGFDWDDKKVRRAGLDYHEFANVKRYPNFEAFVAEYPESQLYACTTKGQSFHHEAKYKAGDSLVFGPETRGLPDDVLAQIQSPNWLRIPMQSGSRSMNLSNAVSVFVYESWRQLDFAGAM
ncbi:tRNA (uridine(34)/cytosine(34)/5-carboxymethylaminomethyluridine(34)-2'-O)-methyltransferase TrmL [Psychrosphaera sp. B3R10]|uniref:tRNA (uridine(34)/cytosine(34)/5- carboxymethylaminomethyluridine(34)-2'-O)- methyltransferase TrmL n=1 Tax=unclassified Psychrosphaera TaxID=2641570 RepID=UPI001C0A3E0C|nr:MULTISPECIES: tRNA (uridine(34)/cytosine(34)/5-carboxymethylaminomethyluridine(34)-2'-O)-methyltransferase TrmL [unclassified Psychrosphaera]MBU2880364.1 tRNA (uridine(34)/cytosine(34)/5-carboxymethylaminomethyluridine(34)-2'-O)-methyltransferase TrmL [Psychrosphaera sp. I2R16]MBU2987803.1 tRNA (uridine(34)/cytosine(34)/5-carboxymethylaminomethyluridine(34)-2'-O)-methyltransferase TrmL [Psychrosphaera sp. B3R10]MDO6720687.1 tRNA (uridine(34)/cytosine(34)/5-carboxymethylaminomethyluridine(34)-